MSRVSGRGGVKGGALRRTLMVGQFAVAVVIIAFVMVIYRQLQFMRQQDKGMNIEQVLVINELYDGSSDSVRISRHEALRNDLLKLSAVKGVTVTGALPGVTVSDMNTTNNVRRVGAQPNGYNFYAYTVDADFVPIMGIKLAAWLQDFALRASMPWWIFALAGGVILVIALLTVRLQSVKAALVNPIDSLGTE